MIRGRKWNVSLKHPLLINASKLANTGLPKRQWFLILITRMGETWDLHRVHPLLAWILSNTSK
ncbi:hypothetical protein CFP56_019076, partial [Quercus suber]